MLTGSRHYSLISYLSIKCVSVKMALPALSLWVEKTISTTHGRYCTKWYDVFVNCNWVVTRWQYYSTHLHTDNTQNKTKNKKTTQITTNVEKCGPCPVFANFTLAFSLQLRKTHGKTPIRVRKPQSGYSIHITKTPILPLQQLHFVCKCIYLYPVVLRIHSDPPPLHPTELLWAGIAQSV